MLIKRVISSILILSVLFTSLFMGYPYFNIFFGVVIGLMSWEWDNFINKKTTPLSIVYACIGTFCLFFSFSLGQKILMPLMVVLIALFCVYIFARKHKLQYPKLLSLGVLYIGLPALAMNIIIMENSTLGLLWILAISWACDIGGYIFGSTLKGPKLCPLISPKKTWSGFLGGLLLACLFSYLYTSMQDLNWNYVYVLTIILGIISQIGDLLESTVKRYVGVKDTSNLIPGHGGVFDRIDSTTAVVVVYASLLLLNSFDIIDIMIF